MKKSKQKKSATKKSTIAVENAHLLREASKIVAALGKMFAPFCEVVLHDLTKPEQAIIAIECPLSGRKVGQPTTEMGIARIKNPAFQDVIQNYANVLPDGRAVKSTSIGLRNSEGKCIASICLNLDISIFSSMQKIFEQLTATIESKAPVVETLRARSVEDIRDAVETFAAQHNMQPRALLPEQRRELIQLLADNGLLHLRGAAVITAEVLGISRGSVYNALK
jgi:predicted transcriptional regulator YheO